MKDTSKGKFANKGKSILGSQKPVSVGDFLETDGNTETLESVNTESRLSVPFEPRTVREEFKLTRSLVARLKRYAYEKDLKKVDIVTRALEEFFDREGY